MIEPPHERSDVSAGAPVVSVIIPVHGDRGRLASTLACIGDQDAPPPHEVIVVDNGDNGDIEAVVERLPAARLVREGAPGSYVSRNAGVAASRGSVLAFTDADCLPQPEWLRQGVAALRAAGPSCFVGGRIEMVLEHSGAPRAVELWQIGNDLTQDVYIRERGWAATANLFVTAVDFATAGPFDARAESGGDREWGERAVGRGLRPVYSAETHVQHPVRADFRELHRKIARVTRGAVHRQRTYGVSVHPGGHLRALVPPVRSSWRRSAEVATGAPARVKFTAACVWMQSFRSVYALWLLAVRRA